jgi:GGDEF domain-containing protein
MTHRLEANLARHCAEADRPYTLQFSYGLITFAGDTTQSLETLLGEADAAMYAQKQARRASRQAKPHLPHAFLVEKSA